mgnify:CR=1 FL=1
MENGNGLTERMIAPKRNLFPSLLVLIQRKIETAISSLAKTEVFKVRIANEKSWADYLSRIANKIDNLNLTIKNLPKIDMGDSPASIQIQTMSEATINKFINEVREIKKITEEAGLKLEKEFNAGPYHYGLILLK